MDDRRRLRGDPFRITNGREELNVKEFLVNVDIASNVFKPSGRDVPRVP